MVVMVILGVLLLDHALNIAKLLDMTRNGDRSLLVKSILFLSFFQQVHEEWMIYINHRNHKPLLLLALPYHDGKTPFRDIFHLSPPIMVVVVVVEEVEVWQVNMEIQMEFIPTPHFSTAQKTKQIRKSKKQQIKNLAPDQPELVFFLFLFLS